MELDKQAVPGQVASTGCSTTTQLPIRDESLIPSIDLLDADELPNPIFTHANACDFREMIP